MINFGKRALAFRQFCARVLLLGLLGYFVHRLFLRPPGTPLWLRDWMFYWALVVGGQTSSKFKQCRRVAERLESLRSSRRLKEEDHQLALAASVGRTLGSLPEGRRAVYFYFPVALVFLGNWLFPPSSILDVPTRIGELLSLSVLSAVLTFWICIQALMAAKTVPWLRQARLVLSKNADQADRGAGQREPAIRTMGLRNSLSESRPALAIAACCGSAFIAELGSCALGVWLRPDQADPFFAATFGVLCVLEITFWWVIDEIQGWVWFEMHDALDQAGRDAQEVAVEIDKIV